MVEGTMETLTRQLDRVERQNRDWKVLGSVAIALLGLVFLIGATGGKIADEIRAKRFVLVDSDGKDRATLSVDNYGAGLRITDQHGEVRAELVVTGYDSPLLGLFGGRDEKVTLFIHAWAMGIQKGQKAGFVLWDDLLFLFPENVGPDKKEDWHCRRGPPCGFRASR